MGVGLYGKDRPNYVIGYVGFIVLYLSIPLSHFFRYLTHFKIAYLTETAVAE